MRINNEVIIATPIILTSDYYSRPIYLGHVSQYGINVTFTGTFSGIFSLEVSNDIGHPQSQSISAQVTDIQNWTQVSGSEIVASESGTIMLVDDNVGYVWVRLKYLHTSGSCSLNKIIVNTKGA